MHELMHAAGFWHEQSRADRDDYITINWDNIKSGMEFNFLKYDLRKIDHLGAKYDTCSVMHYGAYAFAKVVYFGLGNKLIQWNYEQKIDSLNFLSQFNN